MISSSDSVRPSSTSEKARFVQVVIETPAKRRNKFAYDPERKMFTLRKVLPAGMIFPYDFGFLPNTNAEDGDPIDVLVLMEEPAYPGVLVEARLIGVIEGEEIEGRKRFRNDRLVAVSEASHEYANVSTLSHLPRAWIHELESFFVNYYKLEGKRYKLLGSKGPDAAIRQAKKASHQG